MANKTFTPLEQTISLVEQRAAESQLDLVNTSQYVISKLFMNNNDSHLLRFAQDSASISDEGMAHILQAKLEVNNTSITGEYDSITLYYVRSISLTCEQFTRALQDYSNEYYDGLYVQR